VQHVLPEGFHKIRHFGLYAAGAHARLALARAQLGSIRCTEHRMVLTPRHAYITGHDRH
jgi:hypothetical protein